LNRRFEESLERLGALFATHRLKAALIGGLAASVRGRVRVTEDIDIVVDCDIEKAIELLASLDTSVFRPFVDDADSIVRQHYILPIQDCVNQIRIDLAVGASGFEKMVVDRAVAVEGSTIPIASAEDLLLMKLMAHRPRDLSDIQGIVSSNRSSIDWDYCEEIASQLQETFDFDLLDEIRKLKNR
jgi:hypothetical protein